MEDSAAIITQQEFSTYERILFLDSFRAIAIIMVLGTHTLGYCIPLPDHQKIIIQFIVHTISVPAFFLVDGYLFARSIKHSNKYNYLKNIRKSIFRLLIPWIIFTSIYTLARFFFEMAGFLKEKLIIGHSLQEIALSAYGSVYAPQMYFLASLFLIRLCGPVFSKLLFLRNLVSLLIMFFYLLVYHLYNNSISPYLRIDGGYEPILHALWGFQYYLFGIIIFKISVNYKLKNLIAPFALLFFVCLLTCKALGNIGSVLLQYSYLITLFLLFNTLNIKSSVLNIIGRNTMGLYLIHAPIILKGVSLYSNKFIPFPILNFFAILLGTFFLSSLFVVSLKNIPYVTIFLGEPYPRLSNR